MANNPLTTPLPADLPENWTQGQIVSPNGAEAGLSEQHGYNYLMQQVNAAQEAANTIGEAFSGLPSLGSDGTIPPEQLPPMDYIPTSQKGTAGGVATLGADGLLTPAQAYHLLLSVSAAAAYDPESTYAQGDFCTYQGQLYKANQAIDPAEPWTAAHWTATSIMAELALLDYDPAGTAASAVSTHNADPAAHPDLRQAIAGALTATAQITYNGGAA